MSEWSTDPWGRREAAAVAERIDEDRCQELYKEMIRLRKALDDPYEENKWVEREAMNRCRAEVLKLLTRINPL